MTIVKGAGRPVHEDGATKESSDAKGAVVHEGLFSKGCHSFQSVQKTIINIDNTHPFNIDDLPHITNIPSTSMEDWWFATTTQASGLFSRSVSPLTLSIQKYWSQPLAAALFETSLKDLEF